MQWRSSLLGRIVVVIRFKTTLGRAIKIRINCIVNIWRDKSDVRAYVVVWMEFSKNYIHIQSTNLAPLHVCIRVYHVYSRLYDRYRPISGLMSPKSVACSRWFNCSVSWRPFYNTRVCVYSLITITSRSRCSYTVMVTGQIANVIARYFCKVRRLKRRFHLLNVLKRSPPVVEKVSRAWLYFLRPNTKRKTWQIYFSIPHAVSVGRKNVFTWGVRFCTGVSFVGQSKGFFDIQLPVVVWVDCRWLGFGKLNAPICTRPLERHPLVSVPFVFL